MINTSRRIAIPANVLVREMQGESVLLNLDSEAYFGLDEVGTGMWRALTTQPSVEAAYRELLESYDVEPQRLREDLAHLVEELAAAGLVDVRDA